jgi:general secretion pathway protein M
MMAFWQARTGREQVLLALLCALGLLAGLWAGVWDPVQRARAGLLADIARYDRVTTALTGLANSGAGFDAGLAPVTADMPLPTLIATTADAALLPVSRLVPTANAVDITLDPAPFEQVIGWVQALEQDHALRVLALTISRRPEPGLVSTSLTVGR